jgi:signal transduction histidine kinase
VLSVLIDNAIRHSPAGSAVNVLVAADQSSVKLSVEDNGPGIPADQRANIFARFHRLGASHEGFGLGLAIADAIVGATGGRWEIGDAPSGGARMVVRWARIASHAFDAPSVEQSEQSEQSTEPADKAISSGPSGAQTRPS